MRVTAALMLVVAAACAPASGLPEAAMPTTTAPAGETPQPPAVPTPVSRETAATVAPASSTPGEIRPPILDALPAPSRYQPGATPLPLRPDGFGEILPTPRELVDRRLPTEDVLPPPEGDEFAFSIGPVTPELMARSTWDPACPVAIADLRHVTVSFWGFDARAHTGELIVGRAVADDVVAVFARLHAVRFPIEEMRVIGPDELALAPTGDGNVTTAFVCRSAVGSSSWSRHALGLAIDVNPFHNPYVRGDLVLPELASAYADRSDRRPGMILPGDEVTSAFAAIGWRWGGDWSTLVDWMHFSVDGR